MVNKGQGGDTLRKDTGSQLLGQFLAARRTARGLSLRQLSALIGRAPSTVQAWEQGKRMPSLEDLLVLARVLETDVEELVYLAVPTESEARRELKQAEAAGSREGERQAVRMRQLLAARREARKRKALELLRPVSNLRRVPFAGDVAAGPPKLTVEQPGEYIDVLDEAVDYALVVKGDSMLGAGINDGDTVWVRRGVAVNNGDTVVALINGEEITVKHLVEENGQWVLRANNPYKNYPDIPLGPRDEIIGVVKWVVKRPGPPPVRATK